MDKSNKHIFTEYWICDQQCWLLYVCEEKTDAGLVVIVIYVDDLIITGDDKIQIANVKKVLGAEFDMKDLGELMYFLGIEVIRTS